MAACFELFFEVEAALAKALVPLCLRMRAGRNC
jgi:hypothetical protein